MNKILTLSLLVLFATLCSAQSLKLTDDKGLDIGGTVHYEREYDVGGGFNAPFATFQVENLTVSNLFLKVKLENVYAPYTNSHLILVAGIWMAAANPNVAGPQGVGFGDSVITNSLYGFRLFPSSWMWVNANDSAVWNVTFYNAQDTTDSVAATIVWKKEVLIDLDPVSVEENVTLNKFNIFPNPVIGNSFTINNLSKDSEEVILYDVAGREVVKYLLDGYSQSLSINVTELDTGIYYCTVNSAGNIQKTQKVIIQ